MARFRRVLVAHHARESLPLRVAVIVQQRGGNLSLRAATLDAFSVSTADAVRELNGRSGFRHIGPADQCAAVGSNVDALITDLCKRSAA